jgi:hypothetical protein
MISFSLDEETEEGGGSLKAGFDGEAGFASSMAVTGDEDTHPMSTQPRAQREWPEKC